MTQKMTVTVTAQTGVGKSGLARTLHDLLAALQVPTTISDEDTSFTPDRAMDVLDKLRERARAGDLVIVIRTEQEPRGDGAR